jgi:ribosomal protein S18 acetylase RimI-like enzyme
MEITIRKAIQADCHRMMELVKELAVYEKAPDEITVQFDHFVESGFGEKPVWWALVAETTHPDGIKEVQAFALYYIRYSTWKGQRMYLEDLLVTEKLRGQGIGKRLFDQLIEEAKRKKYKGISWQVLDWNEPAINFYKKLDSVQFDTTWMNCSLEIK